jgi:hypothetical protein
LLLFDSGLLVFSVNDVLVGVKEGDLIEYQVTYTGDVPEEHDVTWAKIEVRKVEDPQIELAVTSRYSDGTEETLTTTLNLFTGQIADCFIIPANLNLGDTFLDQVEGTITINGIEERTYANTKRTVVTASTTHTEFVWDRTTGFLVEAASSYSDFILVTTAEKTNIWQTQTFGVDPLWSIVLIALVFVLIIAIFLRRNYIKSQSLV